jgi:acyl-ACP thioesterase
MIESQEPDIYKLFEQKKEVPESVRSLYFCINNKKNKPYLVTNSVIEHLDLLKITKKGEHYNWDVFRHLPNQKVTFIFNNNVLLRMVVSDNTLWFCHMKFTFDKGDDDNGQMYWIMFFIKRDTGELCEHFEHPDVKNIEEFVYKFLCFFYLTENQEEIVPPGKVIGTRKTGKVSNDFKFPLTMVTSKWNTTVIRTEQFGVRGHFRVQPCGPVNDKRYEVIFIEPFVKHGYKRTAGKIKEGI